MALISQLIFILLCFSSIVDYVRFRDEVRLNIVLMFATLAIPILASLIGRLIPLPQWIEIAAILPLLAQPYVLLRLVRHIQPISRLFQRFALASMVRSDSAIAAGSACRNTQDNSVSFTSAATT